MKTPIVLLWPMLALAGVISEFIYISKNQLYGPFAFLVPVSFLGMILTEIKIGHTKRLNIIILTSGVTCFSVYALFNGLLFSGFDILFWWISAIGFAMFTAVLMFLEAGSVLKNKSPAKNHK